MIVFMVCAWAYESSGDITTICFAVMDVGGKACVTDQKVVDDKEAMGERLAQANISVPEGAPEIIHFNAPAWCTNGAPWLLYTNVVGTPFQALTSQAQQIMDAIVAEGHTLSEGIWCIYVPKLEIPFMGSPVDIAGYAVDDTLFKQSADAGYLNNCFISATKNAESPFVLVHEVLHIWGLEHVQEGWNLMQENETSPNKNSTGTKRLTKDQINTIRKKFE